MRKTRTVLTALALLGVLASAASLLAGLAPPAAAFSDTVTAYGEGWRIDETAFEERYMTDYAAQHREEYAAFDADAYYRAGSNELSKEEYLTANGWGEEEFRREMWRESLKLKDQAEDAFRACILERYEAEFPGDIDAVGLPWALMVYGWESVEELAAGAEGFKGDVEATRRYLAATYVLTRRDAAYNHERALEYRAQYPGSYESYDPDKGYEGYWAHQKDNTMARYGIQNEVEWKEWRYARYMEEDYAREQERAAEARRKEERFQALLRETPERYAGFDPYAWFRGYYGQNGAPLESYMTNWGLDEAGFKREMFMEWADRTPTAFFNGCCVTVDGTPIQFQSYWDVNGEPALPRVENQHILVPVRAVAEALGLTVEWRPETGQVVCSNDQKTVIFTLGSLEYSGGILEAAPYAEKGVTYLPLRALGEALGCNVEWHQDFATAAITTQK